MDLLAERGRRVTVDELNTTRLLAHARKQAVQRNLDDMLIVDVDAHHYESENYSEFLEYMENDVLKQLTLSGRAKNRQAIVPSGVGYQDMGGRVTRYPMRGSEKTEAGAQFLPLASQTSASPTEVMTTTSALLKAANLAVFELGMWQSWTGR